MANNDVIKDTIIPTEEQIKSEYRFKLPIVV